MSKVYYLEEMGVCAVNGLLYVVGGDDGSCNLASVEYYNPTTDKWTVVSSCMSTGRSYAGALRRQSLAGRVGLTILTPSGEPMAGTASDSLARVARCRQPYRPITARRRRDGSPRKPITTARAAPHSLTRGGGFLPGPQHQVEYGERQSPGEHPGEGTGREARR
ncbi:hypothetical protein QTO34_015897 [Cnephaeus nilssonii]|uniref:Uncharacterized protein n=1 Tax=Cnephaeus nilssonii TaxID=3371016 RepID=A0AA40LTK8_CNENI|nr:hypothetical protein QTO34_015897 [Eptesicus nilssonii]